MTVVTASNKKGYLKRAFWLEIEKFSNWTLRCLEYLDIPKVDYGFISRLIGARREALVSIIVLNPVNVSIVSI